MKCPVDRRRRRGKMSHPARGAWIEIAIWIQTNHAAQVAPRVAPRKGCVD